MSARQRLIVLFSLFALSVLLYSSPAHAVLTDPHEDQGIYLSQRFMQWDSPWKFDYYAGKEITENGKVIGKYMKDHGCLVTSFAMLFNYYGLMHIPDVSNNYAPKINPICIDPAIPDYQRWELCRYWGLYLKNEPRTLNTWLTENNIYVERRTTKKGKPYVEDLLNSETVAKKFWVRYQGAGMYNYYVEPQNSCQPVNNRANCYEMPWSSSAETLLDIDILNKKPAIMLLSWTDSDGTPHPGHFVLIGGYSESDTSYRAYDPNQYYNRQEMYPPGLNKLYSDGKEGHTKLRINRFKAEYYVYPYQPDMSFISILGMSPIEMQIIDPHGNATGLDSSAGVNVANISRAYYGKESEISLDADESQVDPVKKLFIDKPAGGNFILKIFGTGDGPYTIKMQGQKGDGTENLNTEITGTASPSLRETYRIVYSPTGEASLSQTNQAPVANAVSAQTGEVSYEITLDGSGSSDPDSDPMQYTWSLVSKPEGSTSSLSDAENKALLY